MTSENNKDSVRKPVILVIDDAPDNLSLMFGLLKDQFTVLGAASGEAGLKLAQSDNSPDLILLDVMMPGMSGYDVIKELKRSPATEKIPVIFITAKVTEEDEVHGLEHGAVDYITKPFNPSVVMARVKTHIELKRHRDFMEWMLSERTCELEQLEKEYRKLFRVD